MTWMGAIFLCDLFSWTYFPTNQDLLLDSIDDQYILLMPQRCLITCFWWTDGRMARRTVIPSKYLGENYRRLSKHSYISTVVFMIIEKTKYALKTVIFSHAFNATLSWKRSAFNFTCVRLSSAIDLHECFHLTLLFFVSLLLYFHSVLLFLNLLLLIV